MSNPLSLLVNVNVNSPTIPSVPNLTVPLLLTTTAVGNYLTTRCQTINTAQAFVNLATTGGFPTDVRLTKEYQIVNNFLGNSGNRTMVIGQQTNGDTTSSALTACQAASNQWFPILSASTNDADKLTIAAFSTTNQQPFFTRSGETNAISLAVGTDTTSLPVSLSNANSKFTMGVWNVNADSLPTNDGQTDGAPDADACAVACTWTPGNTTMCYQQLINTTPSILTPTQKLNLTGKNFNWYGTVAGVPMLYNGICSATVGTSVWMDSQWLLASIVNNLVTNVATGIITIVQSGSKFTFDTSGIAAVISIIKTTMSAYQEPANSGISENAYYIQGDSQYNPAGVKQLKYLNQYAGYYVVTPNYANMTLNDRASRVLGATGSVTNPPIQVVYWPAGAIQAVGINLWNYPG